MFDQSLHWGLRTAFHSVHRPLLICAKLGKWVYGVNPKMCQGFLSPGSGHVNVGASGRVLLVSSPYHASLRLSSPLPCLSSSLKLPLFQCQTSFSQLPTFLDLSPLPWPPGLKEKRSGGRRTREKGFTGQVGERMRSALLRNRWGGGGRGLGRQQEEFERTCVR